MDQPTKPKLSLRGLSALLVLCVASSGCVRPAQATPGADAVSSNPSRSAPFATAPMLPGTLDIATLVSKVDPAVVNITTVHEVRARGLDEDFFIDPFGMFGNPRRRGPRGDQVFKQRALGSGFIVDADGHVVTNAHVVDGADAVKVRLADDRQFDAKVVGRDPKLDLAVLSLGGAKGLPYVTLGSSEEIRVGDHVVAIGNPFGLGHTVTQGIISAKSRTIGAGPYDDFLQTDASINPGNSGGPLFNVRGQVIGINTAINPNGQGIGFAIPVDALKSVLPQLLTKGRVARGKLGVQFQPIDEPLAAALGLERTTGALVGAVEPGGPADRAGLKPGDVILKIGSQPVGRASDLPRLVAMNPPGARVSVQVVRDKVTRSFDITLDALKDDAEQAAPGDGPQSGQRGPTSFGIGLADVPGQGVAVQQVVPNGPADGALVPGDIILEVNRQPVRSAAEVVRVLGSVPSGRSVLLKVQRDGAPRYVGLERP